jgi:broad specificity phosphatase PhoE
MKHIVFIRHSKVEQNPSVDSAEWRLSENGRILTQQLATQLSDYQPTRIITSPEPKAVETGQILASAWQTPCHSTEGLQEHDRRGAPYFASQQDFVAAVGRLFNEPDVLVFGNETAVQARVRFDTAVSQQINQHPNDTLAIVSHGTVMTLFTTHCNPQLDISPFWQGLTLPCALIFTLPNFQLLQQIDIVP